MFNVCPSLGSLHECGRLFSGASPKKQSALFKDLATEGPFFDDEPRIDWTDDAIVHLHFLLLDECEKLADPETPLEEKLDILRWIYTDPEKDDAPFSFANCLKVFGR